MYDVHINHIYVDLPNFVNVTMSYYIHVLYIFCYYVYSYNRCSHVSQSLMHALGSHQNRSAIVYIRVSYNTDGLHSILIEAILRPFVSIYCTLYTVLRLYY